MLKILILENRLIAEVREEAAELFGSSQGTVETHRAHIASKLDIQNTVETGAYAVGRGLIS